METQDKNVTIISEDKFFQPLKSLVNLKKQHKHTYLKTWPALFLYIFPPWQITP